jgi:hypothetical protein
MEDHNKTAKDDSSISWITRPAYKLLVLSFALHYFIGKELGGSAATFLMGLSWLAIGVIIIANGYAVVSFFGGRMKAGRNKRNF